MAHLQLMLFRKNIEYEKAENIGNVENSLIEQCYNEVVAVTERFQSYSDFLQYAHLQEEKGHRVHDLDLMTMLLLIFEEKYEEAASIAKQHIGDRNLGRFPNEGKYIHEHIVDYCNAHLLLDD